MLLCPSEKLHPPHLTRRLPLLLLGQGDFLSGFSEPPPPFLLCIQPPGTALGSGDTVWPKQSFHRHELPASKEDKDNHKA